MTQNEFIQRSAMETAANIIAAFEDLTLGDIAHTSVSMATVLAEELERRGVFFDN